MEIEEIKVEPIETHKEFYVAVNYYQWIKPYVTIIETLENSTAEKFYKIRIPYKNIKD